MRVQRRTEGDTSIGFRDYVLVSRRLTLDEEGVLLAGDAHGHVGPIQPAVRSDGFVVADPDLEGAALYLDALHTDAQAVIGRDLRNK